jgi:hypothetical protein
MWVFVFLERYFRVEKSKEDYQMEALKFYSEGEELPTIWDFPLIQQLHNTCGLASILMLTDPENNEKLHDFFEKIADLIHPLLQKIAPGLNEKESIYQYVLEYLLLKSQSQNDEKYQFLNEYLNTRFGAAYKDQKTINNYILTAKREKFLAGNQYEIAKAYDNYILEGHLVHPTMLEDETHTMKTDLELKILFEILGYQYIPTESGDGTGALYFSNSNAWESLNTLCLSHINYNRRILYGFENHWTAVIGLFPRSLKGWKVKKGKIQCKSAPKDFFITFNDPIPPTKYDRIIKGIDSSHRFYVFEDRQENLKWLWDQIIDSIKEDIQEEIEEIDLYEPIVDPKDIDPADWILDDEVKDWREHDNTETQRIRQKYSEIKPVVIKDAEIFLEETEPQPPKSKKIFISEDELFE